MEGRSSFDCVLLLLQTSISLTISLIYDSSKHPPIYYKWLLWLNNERTLFFFLRFYLFIFRERGREGKREGEKHQCVVVSCVPPTGDLACNPGTCSDWELNRQPSGSQACTQSTELHHPGLGWPLLSNASRKGFVLP